jgi:RHS repeat-associated protein
MGKSTSYTYNELGKVATITDPMNHCSVYTYDSLGRNASVQDAANNTSTVTYDLLGNVTRLAGPLGGATNYTYDDMGRLISESTVSGGTVQYTYNELNIRKKRTNARGQVRQMFYDNCGRITGYTDPEGTVSYTYDANGNVLTVTDRNGVINRTYDALNRVVSCTDTNGNLIRYEYDEVGNLTKLIYPDNTVVNYAYDANHNLVRVIDWAGRVTHYTYDVNNRLIGITKPDGSVTTMAYDNKQRVISSVERNFAGVVITGYEYTYDDLSRIVEEKVLPNSTKMCYTYDSLSRVTKRTVKDMGDAVLSEESFAYDAAGNITAAPNDSFLYDTNNRLTVFNGNAVSYDLDGNMLSDGVVDYTYDSANRLVAANGHTYTYNAEDVRIRNLCDEEDTTYVYNTNCRLSQLLMKTTNGVVTKYVYGCELIGEECGSVFKTYCFDFRGSTVALTDITGNITDTFTYDTYGKMIGRTGTSQIVFGYSGRDGVMTDKNGLIYMRARYYAPVLRRFVNADVVSGGISNAVTLNRFAYANGNPVSLADPFGLTSRTSNGPYGSLIYNGEEYFICIPNNLNEEFESHFDWKTVAEVTESDFSFDWVQFVAGFALDDVNGMADGSNNLPATNIGLAHAGGLGLFGGVLTSAANSGKSTFVNFCFQQSGEYRRVIIRAGSSDILKIHDQRATGVSFCMRNQYGGNVFAQRMVSENAKNMYTALTGKSTAWYDDYDFRFTFDERREGSPYGSYLWINEDGKIMETPIVYSNDKVEIGKCVFLGFGFDPLLNLTIDETSPVAEEYQKLFDAAF